MSTGNYTFGCSPCFDPSCPTPVLPIDGFGGSLYDCSFKVPVYNDTYSTNLITWHKIDTYFYQPRAANVTVFAISLGFGILTLANIIVLTPPHKRGLLHNTLLIGNAFQIIRSGIGVQLWTSGYLASSYLALTLDWNTPNWSTSFRVLLTIFNLSVCIVFACVQIAFYTVSHGMLAWMRIRYPMYAYYILISTLVFIGLFSYCWRVVYAVDQIRFIAFAKQGDYLPAIQYQQWYRTLEYGGKYLVGINLGLWSGTFMVSALVVIWERRKALFARGVEVREKGAWIWGRKKRVKNVYERVLNLVAIVGVESFFVPLMLCVFQFLPEWLPFPQTDALVMPVILTLLPVLSLFNGGTIRAETDTGVGGNTDRNADATNNPRHREDDGSCCNECGWGNRSRSDGLPMPMDIRTVSQLGVPVSARSLFGSQRAGKGDGIGAGNMELAEREGKWTDGVNGVDVSTSRKGRNGRTAITMYERELRDIDETQEDVDEGRNRKDAGMTGSHEQR